MLTGVAVTNTARAEDGDDQTAMNRSLVPLGQVVGSRWADIVSVSYDVSPANAGVEIMGVLQAPTSCPCLTSDVLLAGTKRRLADEYDPSQVFGEVIGAHTGSRTSAGDASAIAISAGRWLR
jgi:hypothetical protein